MKTLTRAQLLRLAVSGGAICIVGAATAGAEDVWVTRPRVSLMSEPSAGGNVIAVAAMGADLHVIEHGGPKNAWLKVSVQDEKGTEEGWVFAQSISASKISAAGGGLGSANASALSVGAASKGLEPDAIKYVDAQHLPREPVLEMTRHTDAVRAQLKKFMEQGHVGENAP